MAPCGQSPEGGLVEWAPRLSPNARPAAVTRSASIGLAVEFDPVLELWFSSLEISGVGQTGFRNVRESLARQKALVPVTTTLGNVVSRANTSS
jgi:hypothetical protein